MHRGPLVLRETPEGSGSDKAAEGVRLGSGLAFEGRQGPRAGSRSRPALRSRGTPGRAYDTPVSRTTCKVAAIRAPSRGACGARDAPRTW